MSTRVVRFSTSTRTPDECACEGSVDGVATCDREEDDRKQWQLENQKADVDFWQVVLQAEEQQGYEHGDERGEVVLLELAA